MAKSTITRIWIWGVVVMVVGGILACVSGIVWLAHAADVTDSFRYSYVPDSFFWTMVGFVTLCGIVAFGGFVAQFVAWIGAVLNTNHLADKTWFNLLLWSGIVGIVTSPFFGLGALFSLGVMIGYLVAGPDGMAVQLPERAMPTAPAAPPKTLVSTG